jgi:DNA-binding IclR family transcriptional regulator
MVDLDPSSGKYRLGVHILKLEAIVTNSLSMSQVSAPFLRSLCNESGETAYMVLVNDGGRG